VAGIWLYTHVYCHACPACRGAVRAARRRQAEAGSAVRSFVLGFWLSAGPATTTSARQRNCQICFSTVRPQKQVNDEDANPCASKTQSLSRKDGHGNGTGTETGTAAPSAVPRRPGPMCRRRTAACRAVSGPLKRPRPRRNVRPQRIRSFASFCF